MDPRIERRLRSEPPVSAVVPGSTPVPSFGDATAARVATLGINPSRLEFVDKTGTLLRGDAARFVSLAALGRARLADAPSNEVLQVWEGCRCYFQHRPYRRWFDRLEEQLRAVGASYYDGSAAHLDLAHWATNPVWGKLTVADREVLLDDGRSLLAWQLTQPHLRLVLINGRAVLDAFTRWSAQVPKVVAEFPGLRGTCAKIQRFQASTGVTVLAWSTNLQSSLGVTRMFRQTLARTLAALHKRAV